MVISSQANHLHLMSGCIMQSYLENKAKDMANYTTNMASKSDLNEGKTGGLSVWSLRHEFGEAVPD